MSACSSMPLKYAADTGVESSANDITPFRAIMNDMYVKDISKKAKSIKRDKQHKGSFIGGKPAYGYKRNALFSR